jgi:hypothetical protein
MDPSFWWKNPTTNSGNNQPTIWKFWVTNLHSSKSSDISDIDWLSIFHIHDASWGWFPFDKSSCCRNVQVAKRITQNSWRHILWDMVLLPRGCIQNRGFIALGLPRLYHIESLYCDDLDIDQQAIKGCKLQTTTDNDAWTYWSKDTTPGTTKC